ncbi:MAG: tRNA pseudouridine(38-40) synthase TruA [Hyphomicrobiales bacterium]|nr:tRNA pseudouridine(38-40) synthase TruA [Hyphomicrobiales bacterium]
MPRYKLTLEYDGTPFFGWQRQAGQVSVQEVLESAILGFSGERVTVQAAGRTDTGVHARGQVVHADFGKDWPEDTVRDALNAHLRPHPVAVLCAERTPDDFEARFSATARHYLYRIINRRADLALERNRAWQVAVPLNVDAMHVAAQALIGQHDFTTFRAAECQAQSPVKTLHRIAVMRQLDEIVVTCSARSFLHHQVRSIVGSLKRVGEGKWPVTGVKSALEARDRARCGPVAPACGLYLMRVDYG